MRYRHVFHAGNFADVHKHIALLQLLEAMKKKEKGFHFIDTHAGEGLYDLAGPDARHSAESEAGIFRLERAIAAAPETIHPAIRLYLDAIGRVRQEHGNPRLYPGSPRLAAGALRAADSVAFVEMDPATSRALQRALESGDAPPKLPVLQGDGYRIIMAHLPPPTRRGLVFIDPPYETREEEQHVAIALAAGLARFETGVFALWYPIKKQRDADLMLARITRGITRPTLAAEFCLHEPDHAAGLNGSGLLVVNPPWDFVTGTSAWQVQLEQLLGARGGSRVYWLVREGH
jgi:23S rRNA (adenine2030-N6)-methyltransferase